MDTQSREPSNLQVVAGAGAAAGLVSGLVVALGRRDDEPPPPPRIVSESVDPVLAEAAERARRLGRRVAEAVPEASARFDEGARVAATTARRRAAQASAAVDRDAVDRLAKRAGKAADRGAKKGRNVKKQATRQARDLRTQATKQARGVRKNAGKQARQVGDQSLSAAQAIAAQAAAAAVARAEGARDRGLELAGTAKGRLPGFTPPGNDGVSQLSDVAQQAASAALDLWRSARERAAEAAHEVDLTAPREQIAKAAQAGGDRARGASAALSGRAASLGEGTKVVTRRAAKMGKNGKAPKESKNIPRRAAEATVGTTKDSGAMLVWGAAAGTLVYYAILTPEQRDQVVKTASTVTTQIQELIRDFRGYDDEF